MEFLKSPLPQGTEEGKSVPPPLLNHGVNWEIVSPVQCGFLMGAFVQAFVLLAGTIHERLGVNEVMAAIVADMA